MTTNERGPNAFGSQLTQYRIQTSLPAPEERAQK